jgi:hypothetical protein
MSGVGVTLSDVAFVVSVVIGRGARAMDRKGQGLKVDGIVFRAKGQGWRIKGQG